MVGGLTETEEATTFLLKEMVPRHTEVNENLAKAIIKRNKLK